MELTVAFSFILIVALMVAVSTIPRAHWNHMQSYDKVGIVLIGSSAICVVFGAFLSLIGVATGSLLSLVGVLVLASFAVWRTI
jgi:uncharacterized membrane protein YcaP (DUF421 family)